jgi:hypothetical protein
MPARKREIEDVLDPGERLVWEGRPVGYPRIPRRRALLYGVFVVALVSLPLLALLWPAPLSMTSMTRTTTISWFTITVSFAGTTSFSGTSVPVTGTSSAPGPVILGFAAALIAFSELQRLAHYRARRYGITDRRVLALDRKGRVTAAARGAHEPALEERTLAFGPVRFEGIADPEAARSALV